MAKIRLSMNNTLAFCSFTGVTNFEELTPI